MTSFDQTPL